MAYNLYTILAEKIETILTRNVTNTRGRDYYDAYILLSMNRDTLSRPELLHALRVKAEERDSVLDIDNHTKHLRDIAGSLEIAKIWNAYLRNYPYAKGIALPDILALIGWVFEGGAASD
jgi:predicted nucleotidyltransferase component of viral defense system